MNILIVAATEAEISPLLHHIQPYRVDGEAESYKKGHAAVRICITGVGIAATAYRVGKYLALQPCDLAVQAGIAGAFSRDMPVGRVCRIRSEAFADLGAEDDGRFIDLFDLGFLQADGFPFEHKKLPAGLVNVPELDALPATDGITVNAVSGNENTIQKRREQYRPGTESMEGAAFHYVCLMEKVPFIQIRGISNFVEARDRSAWNIPLAVTNLNEALIRFIETL